MQGYMMQNTTLLGRLGGIASAGAKNEKETIKLNHKRLKTA